MLGPEQRAGSSTLPLPGAGAEERPEEVEWIESDALTTPGDPPAPREARWGPRTARNRGGFFLPISEQKQSI